jgi:hypothetical protein
MSHDGKHVQIMRHARAEMAGTSTPLWKLSLFVCGHIYHLHILIVHAYLYHLHMHIHVIHVYMLFTYIYVIRIYMSFTRTCIIRMCIYMSFTYTCYSRIFMSFTYTCHRRMLVSFTYSYHHTHDSRVLAIYVSLSCIHTSHSRMLIITHMIHAYSPFICPCHAYILLIHARLHNSHILMTLTHAFVIHSY